MAGRSNMRGGTADLFQGDGGDGAGEKPDSGSVEPDHSVPLLQPNETEAFQARWEECLRGFVDEPRASVQQADELVADVIRQLADQFSQERGRLEEQWDRGDEVSTEALRIALQRYRSFFNRLLHV